MNVFKRGICAAIIIAMTGLLLAGCGKSQKKAENDSPIVINLETYYNGAAKIALDQLVTDFNNTEGSEKGIFVKTISKGDMSEMFEDLEGEMNKDEDERNLPDIFCCYSNNAVKFYDQGLLANLDDYFTKNELDTYVDSYIDEGRIGKDKELLILPVAKSVEVLTLNKTDWDKFAAAAGASLDQLSTWEGLAEVSAQYYEWSGGKAMFGRDAFANYMLTGAYQLGEEFFLAEDGKTELNLDETTLRKLWDNYYVPYVKGYYTSVGRYRSDDMKTGDLIAAIGSSSAGAFYAQEVTIDDAEAYSIETIELPVPNFEGTASAVIQQGAGMVITKSDAAKEEAAARFLKWFTDAEVNTEFCLAASYLPVKKEANDIRAIEAVAGDSEIKVSSLVHDTMSIAFGECNSYALYYMRPFEGSEMARGIVNTSMSDKASADRESLAAGTVTLETLLTDENFENWCQEFQQQLEEKMK